MDFFVSIYDSIHMKITQHQVHVASGYWKDALLDAETKRAALRDYKLQQSMIDFIQQLPEDKAMAQIMYQTIERAFEICVML